MYVKKGEKIPIEMKQLFANNFSINLTNKNVIIKMKNDKAIEDIDLEICKVLYRFRFTTVEQIEMIFNIKGKVKERLDRLVYFKILNKFMIHDGLHDDIQDDAMHIYCLDIGGRYLLENYSNFDVTDWFTSINMRTSEQVDKILTMVNIYISLIKTCPNKLIGFKVEPNLRVGKTAINPSFDFTLKMNDHQVKNFVGEIIKEYDLPIMFGEKAIKLESLLTTNGWKKYYFGEDAEPVLLLFTENDKDAHFASKILEQSTSIVKYRVSTESRIRQPLHKPGAFLKYDKDEDLMQEIKAVAFEP